MKAEEVYGILNSKIKQGVPDERIESVVEKYIEQHPQTQADWNETDNTNVSFIKNKPSIPSLDGYATEEYVNQEIANIDKLTRKVVYTVPTPETAEPNVIYMVKDETVVGSDKYREYMLFSDGTVQCIGDTSVDLSGYAKKTEIPTVTNDLTDELKANYDEAYSLAHTHTNKPILDNITAEKVAQWDSGGTKVQSDWNEVDDTSMAFIKNKPDIPTVPTKVSELENDSNFINEQTLIDKQLTSNNLVENVVKNASDYDDFSLLTVEMDLKPNTTYAISFNATSSNGGGGIVNGNIFTEEQYFGDINGTVQKTFIATTKASLSKDDSAQYKNGWRIITADMGDVTAENVQIEVGEVATPYAPYTPNNYVLGEKTKTNTVNIATNTEKIADISAYVGFDEKDVYGVEVDVRNNKFTRLGGAKFLKEGSDFDNLSMYGGRKRCIITNSGVVLEYFGRGVYTDSGALTTETTVGGTTYAVGTKVQVMVEQPKFYYKVVPLELESGYGGKGYKWLKARFYVSETPRDGFKVHPAFVRSGREVDKIYLSAYHSCGYDSGSYILNDASLSSSAMLSSIAGAIPATKMTRSKHRGLAANRGSGWTMQTIQARAATQLLFLIEYASFNSQEKIGTGVNNKTANGTNNMSEKSGATASLGNRSGSVTSNGYNHVSYRGEENLWGNCATFVDAINTDAGTRKNVYVTSGSSFADSTTSGYTDIGFHFYCQSYLSAFGYNSAFDWIFLGNEYTNGRSNYPIGDSQDSTDFNGWVVDSVGGKFNSGLTGGLFYHSNSTTPSTQIGLLGSRIMYFPNS